jgi:hypothetical protein
MMMKQVKKEERLKFFVIVFLGVPFFISLFSALAGVTPANSETIVFNLTSAYIALGLNIIFWSFGLAYRFSNKKTVLSWLFLYIFSAILMPALGGVMSLNLIYAGFPTWMIIVPLGAMYIIAALLPFINEKLSENLHTEIFAPRSCIGRLIQISFLALAPIAGVFGAFLSGAAERSGGVRGYAVLGLIFHFLFVWGTISIVQQAWARRPWKSINKE